jgi:acetoacetate decarboxylase
MVSLRSHLSTLARTVSRRPASLRTQLSNLARTAAPGRWIFEDARFVALEVALDPAAIAATLPFGLSPSRPARATLFVAHYPRTTFGSVYNEAGLFVHLRFPRGAVHCPWMLVDDDVALITGRELLGYPKKIGRIDIDIDGDRIRATVTRRGSRLLSMRGTCGAADPSPPPMLGRRAINVRGTLPALGGQRLITFVPREKIIEARRAEIELAVDGGDRDPIHQLGIERVIEARTYRVNIGGDRPPIPVAPTSPFYWLRNWTLRYQ